MGGLVVGGILRGEQTGGRGGGGGRLQGWTKRKSSRDVGHP